MYLVKRFIGLIKYRWCHHLNLSSQMMAPNYGITFTAIPCC